MVTKAYHPLQNHQKWIRDVKLINLCQADLGPRYSHFLTSQSLALRIFSATFLLTACLMLTWESTLKI